MCPRSICPRTLVIDGNCPNNLLLNINRPRQLLISGRSISSQILTCAVQHHCAREWQVASGDLHETLFEKNEVPGGAVPHATASAASKRPSCSSIAGDPAVYDTAHLDNAQRMVTRLKRCASESKQRGKSTRRDKSKRDRPKRLPH